MEQREIDWERVKGSKTFGTSIGIALGTVIGLLTGTGVWLMSQTDYSYGSCVGGWTLMVAGVGAIVGFINRAVDWSTW